MGDKKKWLSPGAFNKAKTAETLYKLGKGQRNR